MSINRPLPLIGCLLAIVGLSYFFWLGDAGVTEENRLLENAQVAFLLFAALLHGSRWRRADGVVARDFYACLGLLCLSMVVREVDIDRLGEKAIFAPLEKGVRGLLVLGWLMVGGLLFRHRLTLWMSKRTLFFSSCSLVSLIGISAYGFSWFFDKEIFPLVGPVQKLMEESIQLSGTFLFAAAAIGQPFEAVLSPYSGCTSGSLRV
jgi:hypothetical protein